MKVEKELDDLNKRIVAEEELPRVLESISKFADTSSVRVLKMKPVVAAPQKGAKKPEAKQGAYARQKISLSVISSFHELGRFVALLENSPVFLDIQQLEIQADQMRYGKQMVTIVLEVVLRKA